MANNDNSITRDLRRKYLILLGAISLTSIIILVVKLSPRSTSHYLGNVKSSVLEVADHDIDNPNIRGGSSFTHFNSQYRRNLLSFFPFQDPKTVTPKSSKPSMMRSVQSSQLELALPNVLFLGAQKAGSTSISNWLIAAGICRAKSFPGDPPYFAKEVHFFDKDERYKEGAEFYAQRFQHCVDEGNSEMIMDATPDYLTYMERISEFYNQFPVALANLKAMVVLREPIARELSLYNHYSSFNIGKSSWISFEQHAEMVYGGRPYPRAEIGKYVDHLKKLVTFLPRDRLLVLSYDEIKRDAKKAQWRMQQFLGKEFPGDLPHLNSHEHPHTHKVRLVSPQAQALLDPVFREKNEELYQFLEANPGPWMEQRPFPRFVDSNMETWKI